MGFYKKLFTWLPHDLIPQDVVCDPELFDLQNSIDCAKILFIIKYVYKCCNLTGLYNVISDGTS